MRRAFSLIEVSIVIVIIGLLIAGVVGSKHLVNNARITTAQAMTRSSVINGTLNNKLWLESSLDEVNFGEDLTTGDAITNWKDMSPNKTSIVISVVESGPTYSNSINSIQAVKFDSDSENNHLQIDNATFLNGTNYSIFIVEKRMDTNSSVDNYLLGDSGSFGIGYESGSAIIQTHGEGSSVDNQASIEALSTYSNKPRVLTFTHSSVEGNKIYINSTLSNEDSTSNATTHLSGLTTLEIGKGYNGEIGEIAIFDRKLKTVERTAIEDYLSDKWNAPNNREANASCTTGTVTSSGCDASCAAPSVNGITSSASIDEGVSDTYACDDTGYTGDTPSYTCTDGSLVSATPAAGDCVDTNGCADGYLDSGSDTCVAGCDVATITGTSDSGTTVSDATVVTCDVTGYDDSTLGTCSGGTEITGSCTGCDTNYNYYNSQCEQKCDLVLDSYGISGVTVKINSGNSTYDCTTYDGGGSYTGDIILTAACDNGSSLTVDSGTCVEATACTGGDDTDTTTVSGDVIHIFTTVGDDTLTCGESVTAQVLVVGGGGGGSFYGGGGGGGGVVYKIGHFLSVGAYNVTVGDGGGKNTNTNTPTAGGNSIFDTMTAYGGGDGGNNNKANGINGGSGGGVNRDQNSSVAAGASIAGITDGGTSYGNAGGTSSTNVWGGGGGGGGAGEVGGISSGGGASAERGGAGGDGIEMFITVNSTTPGDGVYYAGGGGGANDGNSTVSEGGLGGGGDGGQTIGIDGNDGFGGGGGGATDSTLDVGNGGSGIVIIRYTAP